MFLQLLKTFKKCFWRFVNICNNFSVSYECLFNCYWRIFQLFMPFRSWLCRFAIVYDVFVIVYDVLIPYQRFFQLSIKFFQSFISFFNSLWRFCNCFWRFFNNLWRHRFSGHFVFCLVRSSPSRFSHWSSREQKFRLSWNSSLRRR